MKRLVVALSLSVAMYLCLIAPAKADIYGSDYYGLYGKSYQFVWDGWHGQLILRSPALNSVLIVGSNVYPVCYTILATAQDVVNGQTGPGFLGNPSGNHRIVFYVDFPGNQQRFDGYIMTQTRDAIAGVTWWEGVPYGFYAINPESLPG